MPFTITIIDPCDDPISVTALPIDNKEYTITDTTLSFVYDAFTSDPDWCSVNYSHTVLDVNGDSALPTLSFDQVSRTISFTDNTDLLLSGATFLEYTVTVTGVAGNISEVSGFTSFALKVKNPCINPAFVTIDSKALPTGEEYTLHELKVTGGYSFTHTAFEIVTTPISHTLCGDLTYVATFESITINTTTKPPMEYDTATRIFTIYSEDFILVGTRSISVEAYLNDYSQETRAAPVTTTIEIINPCLDPVSLTPKPIANPAPYYYKSIAVPKV